MIKTSYKHLFNIVERLSVRLWRSDLEVTRRVIGLCNKVQLCIYGRLTKERCVAIYLFVRWFFQAKSWLAKHSPLSKSVCRMPTKVLRWILRSAFSFTIPCKFDKIWTSALHSIISSKDDFDAR